MRPKLTDVAKKAGVSPTTVSRVINNYGYLSEKTTQTYLVHSGNFVKWCSDIFEPGARNKNAKRKI